MKKNKKYRGLLNPRLDANFKAIFTQPTKDSRLALKSFLSSAIGREVSKVHVVATEQPKQYRKQRGSTYDINCTFNDGERAQIELQGVNREYDFGKRAEYYAARLVCTALDVGEDWEKITKSYQISILNFRYYKENSEPFHYYAMTDSYTGAKLSDTLNVIFIELPKVPPLEENAGIYADKNLTSLIKWCKFFKDADTSDPKKEALLDELVKDEEGIMGAKRT